MYLPEGHDEHEDEEEDDAYFPLEQIEQADAPFPEYLPVGQEEQSEELS
jgi:hypothetical protein